MNTSSTLRRELSIVGPLLLAVAALLATVVAGAPTGADRWLAGHIQSIPWGSLDVIPRLGSDFGGGVYGFYIVPALAAIFLAIKREWLLLSLLAGVYVLHFVMISPKEFVTAYRPSPVFGVEGAGGLQSFPSGHVEWATSCILVVAHRIFRREPALIRQ